MSTRTIGSPDDAPAFGDYGSVIAQLKRNRLTKRVQSDLSPGRGVSRLRDETTIEDPNAAGGAEITEDDGEIRLSTGDDGDQRVILETAEPFQYRSGTYANPSMGIRPEKQPSGQVMRWGYFNDDSGVGWGYDSDGLFTFRRESGNDTKHRPPEKAVSEEKTWNRDPLDATGRTGVNLDPEIGHVFEIMARFYGEGPIRWAIEAKDPSLERAVQVVVDSRVYPDKINQVGFDRPIRIEIDNNGTASGLDLFVGGRQFSLWEDAGTFEKREVTEVARGLGISAGDAWENVMAIQKKPSFPPGTTRQNTVRAVVSQIEMIASQQVEVRVAFDAETDLGDSDYTEPEGWPASETATEYALASETPFSVTTDGLPIFHQVGSGSFFTPGTAEEESEVPVGAEQEVVVQARSPSTGADTIDVLAVTVEEQW